LLSPLLLRKVVFWWENVFSSNAGSGQVQKPGKIRQPIKLKQDAGINKIMDPEIAPKKP
jgi:hypothetical protein